MVIDGGATCTSAPLIFRKENDTECKGQTATTEKRFMDSQNKKSKY